MFSAYREIFSLPGALRFSFAGLITRLPLALVGLGLVLYIQAQTDSYGFAGIVAATYMTAQAVFNPLLAKQVDRRGQAKVMVPATVVHVLALTVLLLAVRFDLTPVVFAAAAIAGSTVGSIGALVRARWAALTQNQRQLDAAFSWEAVLDELIFITGPAVVTVLATAVWAPSGVVLSILAVGIGASLLYPQKQTEPAPNPKAPDAEHGRVLRNPGIVFTALSQLCLGVNFGAVDVITVAVAEEHGAKPLAGLALAACALGSLIVGVLYGTLTFRMALRWRYAWAAIALAVLSVPLMFAGNMLVLTGLMFIVGTAVAPMLISGATVIQSLAPPKRLTEALAWISTSVGSGVAIGSALAGVVIDSAGARAGYAVVLTSLTAAAVIIVTMGRTFEPAHTPPREVIT